MTGRGLPSVTLKAGREKSLAQRHPWIFSGAIERVEYMRETYPGSAFEGDGIAITAEAYTRLGNTSLADSARSQLVQKAPQHPWLKGEGKWPDYPSNFRKLNPPASEKSALDND